MDWDSKEAKYTLEIIDIFEDFLEKRGVEIPTSVEEMKEDSNYEGNSARVYGTDWGDLVDAIYGTLTERR